VPSNIFFRLVIAVAIPVIDLTPLVSGTVDERAALARQWDQAFRTAGFAMIVNHGVGKDVISAMRVAATEFFHQPFRQKMAWYVSLNRNHILWPRTYSVLPQLENN